MFLLILLQNTLSFNELEATSLVFQIKTSGFAQSGYCIITKGSHTCPILSPLRYKSPPIPSSGSMQVSAILQYPAASFLWPREARSLLLQKDRRALPSNKPAGWCNGSHWCGVKALSQEHVHAPFTPTASGWVRTSWGWKSCTQQPNAPKQKLRYAAFYRRGVEAKSISYSIHI